MCKESQRRIVTSNRDRLPTRGPHSVTQLSSRHGQKVFQLLHFLANF